LETAGGNFILHLDNGFTGLWLSPGLVRKEKTFALERSTNSFYPGLFIYFGLAQRDFHAL
jgi:hypothetical protein